MTFDNNSIPHTIPIPEPVLPGQLEQLSQIHVHLGNEIKIIAVYWMRSTHQAVCNFDGKWYIQSDQNIMNGIARIIKYEKNIELLTMDDLFVFETPGHGHAADDQLVNDFRNCEWSDYASDRLVFQCVIRERSTDPEIKNKVHNNHIKYDLEFQTSNNMIPLPPGITCYCCRGCRINGDKNWNL